VIESPLHLDRNALSERRASLPAAYRAAREGGSAALRLDIGPDGVVRHAELIEDSGDMLKDRAFVRLAAHFRFTLDLGDVSPTEITLVQPVRVSPRE